MKREDLLAKGYTEEQVTEILNMHHADIKSKNDEIAQLNSVISKNSELETKYKEVQSQLDAINQANMSEQEKLVEREKAIAEKEKATAKIYNTAKAKQILVQTGLTDKELDDLVATALGTSEEDTIAKANIILNTFNNIKDVTEKNTTEKLLNADSKPAMGNTNPNEDKIMTWDKYTSLSQQEQVKFAQEHPEEFANL